MGKHINRTLRKKTAIIEAVKILLHEKNIHSITIDDIKNKAFVSQVTIYNIFGSKDELLTEVLEAYANYCIEHIIGGMIEIEDPEKRLRYYFESTFSLHIENPHFDAIHAYIFSGLNQRILETVKNLYLNTYPHMIKMYEDCSLYGLIRRDISQEFFFKLCDIYTQIDSKFYQNESDRTILLNTLVRSFN